MNRTWQEATAGEPNLLPAPEPAPPWAVVLGFKLDDVAAKMDQILATHEQIVDVVEELKPEVLSVVNSLQSNPMFKMFLGKGK